MKDAQIDARHRVLCGRCLRVHDRNRDKHYHKHPTERCEVCGMLRETELPKCCSEMRELLLQPVS